MRADRLVLTAVLALALTPAAAFRSLDAGQRALLAPLAETWDELDEATRTRLRANASHWQALPAPEQRALIQRMQAWDALPPAERARWRAPFAAWQLLPADEQAQLRRLAARVAALPEAEQQVLRAAFDALPQDVRQDWWLGPKIGADFAGLRPLFAFAPEDERPALLAMLRTLSPQARADLAVLARRLPAAQRDELRRELVAAPAAGREALVREHLRR